MVTVNGKKSTRLRIKKGEVKLFIFKYNVDIQNATFTFVIKNDKDQATPDILIQDDDFDKSEINDKIVKCLVDTSPLTAGEIYFGEMKTTWVDQQGNSIVDKTEDIVIEIAEAVTP